MPDLSLTASEASPLADTPPKKQTVYLATYRLLFEDGRPDPGIVGPNGERVLLRQSTTLGNDFEEALVNFTAAMRDGRVVGGRRTVGVELVYFQLGDKLPPLEVP